MRQKKRRNKKSYKIKKSKKTGRMQQKRRSKELNNSRVASSQFQKDIRKKKNTLGQAGQETKKKYKRQVAETTELLGCGKLMKEIDGIK